MCGIEGIPAQPPETDDVIKSGQKIFRVAFWTQHIFSWILSRSDIQYHFVVVDLLLVHIFSSSIIMKVLTRKATMLSAVAFMLSTGAVASFSPSTRLPNRGGAFLERKTAPSRPSAPATKSSLFMAGQAAASKAPLVQKLVNSLVAVPVFFFRQFQTMTRSQKLTAFCFLAAGFLLGRTKPFWTRYTAVIDIPSSYFGPDAPVLTGRAVRVSDGDTIRFLHTPTPFHSKELQKGEKSSKVALPIRICTIDTPETAKFGKPGQVRE